MPSGLTIPVAKITPVELTILTTAPDSPLHTKVGVLSFVMSPEVGLETIGVDGAAVSIVKVV